MHRIVALLVLSVLPVSHSDCVGFCSTDSNGSDFAPVSSCDATEQCSVCRPPGPYEDCRSLLIELVEKSVTSGQACSPGATPPPQDRCENMPIPSRWQQPPNKTWNPQPNDAYKHPERSTLPNQLNYLFKYMPDESKAYIELWLTSDLDVKSYHIQLFHDVLGTPTDPCNITVARNEHFRHSVKYLRDNNDNELHVKVVPDGWSNGPKLRITPPRNCYNTCPGRCSCRVNDPTVGELLPPRLLTFCQPTNNSLRIAWDYGEDHFAPHPGNASRFLVGEKSKWVVGVIGKTSVDVNVSSIVDRSKNFDIVVLEFVCGKYARGTRSIKLDAVGACTTPKETTSTSSYTLPSLNTFSAPSIQPTSPLPPSTLNSEPSPSDFDPSTMNPSPSTLNPRPQSGVSSQPPATPTAVATPSNRSDSTHPAFSTPVPSPLNPTSSPLNPTLSPLNPDSDSQHTLPSVTPAPGGPADIHPMIIVFAAVIAIFFTIITSLIVALIIQFIRQKCRPLPGKTQIAGDFHTSVLVLFSQASPRKEEEFIMENVVKRLAEQGIHSTWFDRAQVRGSVGDWIANTIKESSKVLLVANKEFAEEWTRKVEEDPVSSCSIIYILHQVIDSYVKVDKVMLEKFAVLYLRRKDSKLIDSPYLNNMASFYVDPQDVRQTVVRFVLDVPTYEPV